jgi:hypothetical protein
MRTLNDIELRLYRLKENEEEMQKKIGMLELKVAALILGADLSRNYVLEMARKQLKN